jgi:hypothetical protein
MHRVLKLEPPYSQLYTDAKTGIYSGEQRVQLYNEKTNESTWISYARYIWEVQYWKDYGMMSPSDRHLDFINGDRHDVRLDNLQLLTHAEYAEKQDMQAFNDFNLTSYTVSRIVNELDFYVDYETIEKEYKIPIAAIRHIVRAHRDKFGPYRITETNKCQIRRMLKNHIPRYLIAARFGVDTESLDTFIWAEMPEYNKIFWKIKQFLHPWMCRYHDWRKRPGFWKKKRAV